MLAVALSLAAAVAYGVSDFLGGLVSRRTSPWPVAFAAAVGALSAALALAGLFPGAPAPSDLGWGAVAGVGGGLGGAFLYRGLAAGRMGVVAPVSAVGAAMVPVAVGVASGERPDLVVWIGILAAAPGIWLVSREPHEGSMASGVVDGVVAGLGFGVLFAAMGQVETAAGLWPLVLNQAAALLVIAATAGALRTSWLPRHRSDAWGLLAGLLAVGAVVAFQAATDQGLLVIAAVLTSLYPAVTILLAAVVLGERIHRTQGAGLALCGVAVALIAAA